jgi:MarR family transcriptional regulator for hemolysin
VDTRSDDEIRADLSYLFDKASQALAARMGTVLGELGMTVREFCVLAKAGAHELTQGELAELALLDKTTMVVTCDNLEKAGLAQRTPSPADRRVRIVRTTEAGDEKVAKARGVIDDLYAEVLGVLPSSARPCWTRCWPSSPTTARCPPSSRTRTHRGGSGAPDRLEASGPDRDCLLKNHLLRSIS